MRFIFIPSSIWNTSPPIHPSKAPKRAEKQLINNTLARGIRCIFLNVPPSAERILKSSICDTVNNDAKTLAIEIAERRAKSWVNSKYRIMRFKILTLNLTCNEDISEFKPLDNKKNIPPVAIDSE